MAKAQNLVPNPSFEDYDTCPTEVSIIGDMQIEHCLGWYAPTGGTSDFYHTCGVSNVNIPDAIFGYQYAFDGDGMLAIALTLDADELPYFEYVQAKLISPLVPEHVYRFSFHVNLANYSDYAMEKIGAWFTSNAVASVDWTPLFSNPPNIENHTGAVTDTVGWRKIEGSFVANGGEEYITIGYYTDPLNPDTSKNTLSADPLAIFAYYYIDGLVLESLGPLMIPNVFTPNGDGLNDLFEPNFSYTELLVYNRWGQKVFESDHNILWDGSTFGGDTVPEGVYYYRISTENSTYKGFVQVMR